jgi:DNA-binding transcriptional LysR family regulator
MSDLRVDAMDLDLRLVRYFTVVAEHRSFVRASATLHLAQPSLSRQIQRLEGQLGARLFDRTPQGSHLTQAGQVFLPQAHALLDGAHRAAANTRAAAGSSALTVGYTSDLVVTPAVRELRRQHPDAEVHTLHLDWNDASTALLDHRVDAAVARLPFPTDRLSLTTLYLEPRVLLVPTSHRLAARKSVVIDDFADEPLVRYAEAAWDEFWRIDPRPDGRPAPDGPLVGAHEDKLELVAGGQALALAPAGRTTRTLRPDVVAIPIEGIGPCQVVVATRTGERSRLVAAFLACARALLTERWLGAG